MKQIYKEIIGVLLGITILITPIFFIDIQEPIGLQEPTYFYIVEIILVFMVFNTLIFIFIYGPKAAPNKTNNNIKTK